MLGVSLPFGGSGEPPVFYVQTPAFWVIVVLALIVLFLLAVAVVAAVLLIAFSRSRTRGNLTPCPDCGRRLSPSAETCPQCGRPMK
jgi:hypothetical protein